MRWLLGILLVAGCAKDVTKDIEGLADRACKCAKTKDTACGKAVLDDMVKLAEDRNVKGDERKAADAAKRLGECLQKSGITGAEISGTVNKMDNPSAPPAESP
jgi:hypothetical protein